PSATHRLNIEPGLSAVWARAKPDFDGAVLSSTTFHTLPSPAPVLSAFHPAGTFPRSAFPNVNVFALSSAAVRTAPATATNPAAQTHLSARVIARPPSAAGRTGSPACPSGLRS